MLWEELSTAKQSLCVLSKMSSEQWFVGCGVLRWLFLTYWSIYLHTDRKLELFYGGKMLSLCQSMNGVCMGCVEAKIEEMELCMRDLKMERAQVLEKFS